MSTAEEILTSSDVKGTPAATPKTSLLNRFLDLLCSVRLGIAVLILLGLACFLGMVVMQQNVSGFDRYYAGLAPAQQIVYGTLGFFDIYHTWYFNALLLFLSLNILLASIDRFPAAWSYISRPKSEATTQWVRARNNSVEFIANRPLNNVVATTRSALKSYGYPRSTVGGGDGRTVIFTEKGSWNRLGAYAVHVGLLTIFVGGFMTTQLGQTGQMTLTPGQKSDVIAASVFSLDRIDEVQKQIPFSVKCTDIRQKLIKDDGKLDATNTIDWMTSIEISDEYGIHEATVQLNRPYDYRGYRFFQSSFVPTSRARTVTLNATPADGGAAQQIEIHRDQRSKLADGTVVRFVDFRGNFRVGGKNGGDDGGAYPNPAAVLQVTGPGELPQTAYAFGAQLSDIPMAKKPVGGYTFELVSFEKVGESHILSVQRDPGANVVYTGFVILCASLVGVFFFSHRRIWFVIEPLGEGACRVTAGGDTNRNQIGFDERFRRIVDAARGADKEN